MEKTKQLIVGLLIVSAVCLAQSPRPTRELMTLLQEAQYQEQTAGDLDKAIELYRQVLTEAAQVERLAARAAFQLAVCYQKKGDTAKAAEYYQKVVNEFPSQKTLAERTAKELEKIDPKTIDSLSVAEQKKNYAIYDNTALDLDSGAMIAVGKEDTPNEFDIGWDNDAGGALVVNPKGTSTILGLTGIQKDNWQEAIRSAKNILPPLRQKGSRGIIANTTPFCAVLTDQGNLYIIEIAEYSPQKANLNVLLIKDKQDTAEAFRQKLEQPVAVNVAQSPDGDRLTVQYAAIAIAEEAGVPYQWDKSAQLAHPQRTRYIAPLRIAGKPAAQALADVLGPVELSFGIDENGVYLYSDEKLKAVVEKAVLTISTCAETDPRVKTSLDSLKGLPDEAVTAAVSAYLDEASPTVRRSAIYILWKGEFSDISAAEQGLLELCGHPENFTRGMAAIALGGNKVSDAYDAIARMTLHDEDAYARRCAAYALGLLGDAKALPVLERALQDHENLVKQNAQTAITMLTKLDTTEQTAMEPTPNLIQEGYDDIQPDGTIRFRSPSRVVNSGTEPIFERRFINSDFVNLTSMTDEHGNPVDFTATHEDSIYRYRVRFNPPIMPGETFVYYSEGTKSGLIKPVGGQKDTYRYYMTHSPNAGQPVLRIEHYLLPEGAELLSTFPEDIERRQKDGRTELRVEKVIPANGSLTTSFTYKLVR